MGAFNIVTFDVPFVAKLLDLDITSDVEGGEWQTKDLLPNDYSRYVIRSDYRLAKCVVSWPGVEHASVSWELSDYTGELTMSGRWNSRFFDLVATFDDGVLTGLHR